MKTSIITPIGMSPPIATELVEYFEKGEEHITDVVLVATENPEVKDSCTIIKTALAVRYPRIHTHIAQLPFPDIQSTEDNVEFMKICAECTQEEKEVHGCLKIYLNIAGGRKDMSSSLVLLGQMIGVEGIFHIISSGVDVVNIPLERIKKEIGDLSRTDNRIEFYKSHQEEFDKVMFPPLTSYSVIRMPCIPFPIDYLAKVMAMMLVDNIVSFEKIDMSLQDIRRLESAGLLVVREDGIYPTDFGRQIGEIMLPEDKSGE